MAANFDKEKNGGWNRCTSGEGKRVAGDRPGIFRWVNPSLYEGVSVRRSVGRSVGWMDGWMVTCYFQMLEMRKSLNENHGADQL